MAVSTPRAFMMGLTGLLVVSSAWVHCSASAIAQTPALVAVSHSVWSSLLQRHVVPHPDGINRIDYARLKAADRARLKGYVASLERASPAHMARDAQKAFWINLYNAKMADIVLDRYPIVSVGDLRMPANIGSPAQNPWNAAQVKVEGRELSLNQIDKILREGFADPRLHYALACPSVGCPHAMPEAFTPERLDQQLDMAATAFINHPRAVRISGGRIEISSLYQKYEADFGGLQGVLAHLSRYARPELKGQLASVKRIDGYTSDWRLNDIQRR